MTASPLARRLAEKLSNEAAVITITQRRPIRENEMAALIGAELAPVLEALRKHCVVPAYFHREECLLCKRAGWHRDEIAEHEMDCLIIQLTPAKPIKEGEGR